MALSGTRCQTKRKSKKGFFTYGVSASHAYDGYADRPDESVFRQRWRVTLSASAPEAFGASFSVPWVLQVQTWYVASSRGDSRAETVCYLPYAYFGILDA